MWSYGSVWDEWREGGHYVRRYRNELLSTKFGPIGLRGGHAVPLNPLNPSVILGMSGVQWNNITFAP
jgi:hypothetical protein